MDSVKDFIKENRLLIIASIIIILACGSYYYYQNKQSSVKYNPTLSEENVTYIKREYAANQYNPVTVELIDVLNEYYMYFIRKQVSNPEEAYLLLTDEAKEKFGSKEEYIKYAKKITTINALNNKIEEYRVSKDNEHIIEIIDSEDNKYTIVENSVWDFKVSLDGKK